jgi:hypothetical protein
MLDVMLDPLDQLAPGPDDPSGKHIDPVAVLDPDGQFREVQRMVLHGIVWAAGRGNWGLRSSLPQKKRIRER